MASASAPKRLSEERILPAPDRKRKSRRHKTAHLKVVPEKRSQREQIRNKCRDVAGKLDKSCPLDRDQMEAVSRAILEALKLPAAWIAERNALYHERFTLVVAGLASVGITAQIPQAALYLWAQIPPGWATSEAFARAVLEQTGVAIAPGSFFGAAGAGYVRVSVTATTDRIREAMARLATFDDRP